MILLDVLCRGAEGTEFPGVIALSQSMGVRIYADATGTCWISCADNSVWKSAHDFKTTIDAYTNLLLLLPLTPSDGLI